MANTLNSAKPRRKYDRTGGPEDFKREAVRLVTTGQRSVPDVARSLGISENILYRWKGQTKRLMRRTLTEAPSMTMTNYESNCTEPNKIGRPKPRDILKKPAGRPR